MGARSRVFDPRETAMHLAQSRCAGRFCVARKEPAAMRMVAAMVVAGGRTRRANVILGDSPKGGLLVKHCGGRHRFMGCTDAE